MVTTGVVARGAAEAAEIADERLMFGVLGLIGVAVIWLAWSGRWRSWQYAILTFWLVTVWPPTCALFLLYALTAFAVHPVVVVLALLFVLWWLAGWVLLFVRPAWYGPRWYREERRARAAEPPVTNHVPAERNSEQVARAARAPRKPLARRRVLLLDPAFGRPHPAQTEGTAAGHLLLYPDELVFAADRGDDAVRPGPTVRSLIATDIVDIRPDGGTTVTGGQVRLPRLHVETTDGPGWTFEAVRAGATLDDLRQVYLEAPHRP
ncbi:hypothetical protein GCM10023200_01730 [Actinomycetospora chlora]|uniref:Uncharacterized protein n=1 Tax=Actinomycetospora chlora TaxID=663608 RepID=A0ABP9A2X0_9PSEU